MGPGEASSCGGATAIGCALSGPAVSCGIVGSSFGSGFIFEEGPPTGHGLSFFFGEGAFSKGAPVVAVGCAPFGAVSLCIGDLLRSTDNSELLRVGDRLSELQAQALFKDGPTVGDREGTSLPMVVKLPDGVLRYEGASEGSTDVGCKVSDDGY